MSGLKNFILKIFPIFFFGAVKFALAQAPTPVIPGLPTPVQSITSLGGASGRPLETLIIWFIGIFWVLAVAMVVWAAFLYLTAGGNEEKITEAKKRLLYAVIAAAIALVSGAINTIVYYLLAP